MIRLESRHSRICGRTSILKASCNRDSARTSSHLFCIVRPRARVDFRNIHVGATHIGMVSKLNVACREVGDRTAPAHRQSIVARRPICCYSRNFGLCCYQAGPSGKARSAGHVCKVSCQIKGVQLAFNFRIADRKATETRFGRRKKPSLDTLSARWNLWDKRHIR